MTGPASPSKSRLTRCYWLLPVLATLAVYGISFNNYFAYDDFIWLERSSNFNNWLDIFRPDVFYFDPLVHIFFRANYLLGALDPRWYHGANLAIHAVNSLLVYRLVSLVGNDEKTALYASLLFASSAAIADAVIWPSSRVDLLTTLCSLGVLIQYLHFLRSKKRRHLLLALLCFVLALGAKGTPLLLPLVILWLTVQDRQPLRRATCLFPFAVVAILYWNLLHLTRHLAALPLDRLHFNTGNVAVAFCALFIPERYLHHLDLLTTAAILFVAITTAALSVRLLPESALLRSTGYCLMVIAILPFLIITDFSLVSENSHKYQLLSSPSHRLYLASIGAAMLGGALLRSCQNLCGAHWPRLAGGVIALAMIGAMAGNAVLVKGRNKLWAAVGSSYRCSVEGLCAYRGQVGEGSRIGLINFTGSRGFVTPMLKLCLGINDFTVMPEVTVGMVDDPELLKGAEKSFVFVLGNDDRVYDKSALFRRQFTSNLLALQHPEQLEYQTQCLEVKKQLTMEIGDLLRKPLLKEIYGS